MHEPEPDDSAAMKYFETLIRASIYGAAYVRGVGLGLSAPVARRFAATALAQYVMLPEASLEQLIKEGVQDIEEHVEELKRQAAKTRKGAS